MTHQLTLKAKQERVVNLQLHIKRLEEYRRWCVEARDPMREENTCLALGEFRDELRALRRELRA